jgi:hypothetical protein
MSASVSPSAAMSWSGRSLAVGPAGRVDRDVAADQHQPGGRVARRAVLRPGLEGAQAGFLKRLLGGVEVAEVAQQGRQRLRTRGGQRRVDPGEVGPGSAHAPALPGQN